MELTTHFAQVVHNMVLHPDWTGAVVLFWFSFLNELVAVVPYAAFVYSQLLFVDAASFHTIVYKLFLFTAIPAGVGGALGSLFIYGLAYFGGQPAIDRFKKYLRFSWEDVEKVNKRFKGVWYDELIFLALRCIPLLPSLPVTLAAGIIKMPPLTYLVLTLVGFTLRMMIMFLFIGFGVETLGQL